MHIRLTSCLGTSITTAWPGHGIEIAGVPLRRECKRGINVLIIDSTNKGIRLFNVSGTGYYSYEYIGFGREVPDYPEATSRWLVDEVSRLAKPGDLVAMLAYETTGEIYPFAREYLASLGAKTIDSVGSTTPWVMCSVINSDGKTGRLLSEDKGIENGVATGSFVHEFAFEREVRVREERRLAAERARLEVERKAQSEKLVHLEQIKTTQDKVLHDSITTFKGVLETITEASSLTCLIAPDKLASIKSNLSAIEHSLK